MEVVDSVIRSIVTSSSGPFSLTSLHIHDSAYLVCLLIIDKCFFCSALRARTPYLEIKVKNWVKVDKNHLLVEMYGFDLQIFVWSTSNLFHGIIAEKNTQPLSYSCFPFLFLTKIISVLLSLIVFVTNERESDNPICYIWIFSSVPVVLWCSLFF